LKKGLNKVVFTVESLLLGMQQIEGRIYYYDADVKLVVSDVDGTVSISDVIGLASYFVGFDWVHPGICELYNNVEKRGYQMVYLTARPLAYYAWTRDYIDTIQ